MSGESLLPFLLFRYGRRGGELGDGLRQRGAPAGRSSIAARQYFSGTTRLPSSDARSSKAPFFERSGSFTLSRRTFS